MAIKMASPEEILKWSYGEVLKPETLNYRTQRPEKDGLFSERIFGPTRDYECYCGKYKKIRYKGIVCERCGVEVTHSSVRRERMGHIELATPVVHIWLLKTIRSKLGTLLDISVNKLERVVYYAAYLVTNVDDEQKKQAIEMVNDEYQNQKNSKGADLKSLKDAKDKSISVLKMLEPGMVMSEDDYYLLSQKFGHVFEADRGGEAVRKLLERMDLEKLKKDLEKQSESMTGASKNKVGRRIKLIKQLIRAKIKPEWFIMKTVPVLPPELRPMVALDGGRYATADLNDLYRRVINRNNRLKKLIGLNSPDIILTNEKRMLQEAVDALIDNKKQSGGQVMSARRRPLKSLADMLKGKQGRFRGNLLGKRVDYSGRSVIVVGPELRLDQCGLPKMLALEIFRPFVINKIIEGGLAYNIKQANRFIEQESSEVWAILEEVIQDKRVLLNRAPTLHRLGIQAFKPVLIEDLAIRVHPLVCPAFNADFDGDQMAVHLPITNEAQYECAEIMDAKKLLLRPADGGPIVSPTQDMVLGCFYLTKIQEGLKGENKEFADYREVLHAYDKGIIELQTKIKVLLDGELVETSLGRMIFNNILPDDFPYVNEHLNKKSLSTVVGAIVKHSGINNAHIYLDRIKDLGFTYATLSSTSLGMGDNVVPKKKYEIIEETEKEIAEIESQFEEGLLTNEERYERVIEKWNGVTKKLFDLLPETLPKDNSIYSMISSGARGNWTQINQMMGMRGLVKNTQNQTIELPIKSSYQEGLTVLEYFISTPGARKGSTDTALRTASAGYLTRRLVDVSQDVIVRSKDCKTTDGIEILREDGDAYNHSFSNRLYSRPAAEDIKIGRKTLVKKGEVIDRETAVMIEESDIESVKVKSPITCKLDHGICSACYGWDLSNEEEVKEGEAVGVVAAQSIGEPGTQLTMRTFHIGGVAGVDITQGLPRVEEVLEARHPKGKAVISEVDGNVVEIEDQGLVHVVKLATEESSDSKTSSKKGKNVKEYSVPRGHKIFVKSGDEVQKGDVLCEGPMDLDDILKFQGVDALRRYIINEVQKVYIPEGATINDKHIEIIVRQMFSRVMVKDPGDTDFMKGEIVNKSELKKMNKEVEEGGGKKAKATQKVEGITRVALTTESWLSAASFQETSRVLVNASVEGKVDTLRGLKENVIIGKLIPAGTGLRGVPEEVTEGHEDNEKSEDNDSE